jgi:dienelactone hydrolase/lysophospholipase L1-like esterase
MAMRAGFFVGSLLCLGAIVPAQTRTQSSTPELPKVVLIGDSIRLGYAPVVSKMLAGKAVVVSPEPNGGDSANVLANLEAWVVRENPDIVHLNCGLHDLKVSKKTKQHQIEITQYEKNLRQIVARIQKETRAALVFANTTPLLDERHARRGADFDRFEADVARYNAVATRVMKEAGVPVHDLHWVVGSSGAAGLMLPDGTHYNEAGYFRLGEAVADCLLRQITVRKYQPLPSPPSGAQAGADYRKAASERDLQVPEVYKKLGFGTFHLPKSSNDWTEARRETHKLVVQSLGDLPPRPAPLQAKLVSREVRSGYTLEKVSIPNGVDNTVSALLLIPDRRVEPAPAILWLHSSTPDKTQIIIPNTNGGQESLGEAFVRAGYVVLSPDAYWHGDRAGTGPAGPLETSRSEQESLFKLNLWLGRTLWGMFVRDDQIALDYLCSRPEVDKGRIGATGMSMGSTRAWWLAAVDDRVAAAVGVACLTRYQNLIAHGDLRQHGIYYFANGLLKHFDSEGVLALIAPRPFLALTGDLDAGSPADGIKIIEEKVASVYATLGAAEKFRSILYPDVGHAYTPEMRTEMLKWFERWLTPKNSN